MQTSGAMRRETCRPRRRVTQYSRGSMIEPISRGVLDTRLRGYDDPLWWELIELRRSMTRASQIGTIRNNRSCE